MCGALPLPGNSCEHGGGSGPAFEGGSCTVTDKVRVVHYINQFFAGMGGEEAA
ncbi:MAG TPA: hypothetical protein DEP84_04335, partial [Chloroflexi bacterium]|nr:hypothetical protein [Chloroflexota bacterium]